MEFRLLLKSILVLILMANVVSYLYDFISIGKTYSYVYSCDIDKRAGFTIGKGWSCSKDYQSMIKCFNKEKQQGQLPDSCRLLRTFEMKFHHVHRWLHYAFDPIWRHTYLAMPQ